MDSTWSFSQIFSSQFQTWRSDLEARVETAKSSVAVTEELFKELSTDLARLVKSLADATGSLPSYDQRQYGEQLKAIELSLSDLRGASKPKPKFTFKRKAVPSAPIINPSQSTHSLGLDKKTSTPAPTINLSLSGRSYQLLTLESLPTSSSQGDLAIHDLDHCIVNLLPSPRDGDVSRPPLDISALHIQDLTDTVLLLPSIQGSVLVHNLTRCTVVVGCHQYRIHTSKNVDVYLAVTSDPIIEDCSHIHFGEYPSILGSPLNPSKHLNVLDFSHIRSSPSPHWSALGSDRVSPELPLQNMSTIEALSITRERMLP